MLTPLVDAPRLHLQVAGVLRQQAAEAVQLARELRADDDVLSAVEAMVVRVRDTARALGLSHVERAALRALRGMATPQKVELLEELLEATSGGLRAAPMLRPVVVVTGRQDTGPLYRAAQAISAAVRIVPDLASAREVAEREDAAAVVAPAALLDAATGAALRDRLLLAYGREEDLPARLACARLGVTMYLPEPLELRRVVRLVRGRMAAWRRAAWRVLVAHGSRDQAEDLAAALANEELHTIPTVGGFRLLHAIEANGPDLVVIAAPLEGLAVAELTAMLAGHHRFGSLPLLYLWEGGILPAALSGHDVVQGSLDVPALRARVLGALDDQRRERALREHDELTGTLSAAAVLNAADREIAAARRRGDSVAAVRLELDDAAQLEARTGPMGPAEALRLLALVAQGAIRETDSLGVITASGLLLVMPGCSAPLAGERVAVVRQRFAQRLAGDERLAGVSFAAGIADGTDDLLLRAERTLLRALGLVEPAPGGPPAVELRVRLRDRLDDAGVAPE